MYVAYTGHVFYRQIAVAEVHNAARGRDLADELPRANRRALGTFVTRHAVYGSAAVLAALPCWVLMLLVDGTVSC